jgi:uncharacterized damage-inducible protein DinB
MNKIRKEIDELNEKLDAVIELNDNKKLNEEELSILESISTILSHIVHST